MTDTPRPETPPSAPSDTAASLAQVVDLLTQIRDRLPARAEPADPGPVDVDGL